MTFQIYTDGSNDGDKEAGWSFVAVQDQKMLSVSYGYLSEANSSKCEYAAIMRAVAYALSNEIKKFEILTDRRTEVSQIAAGRLKIRKRHSETYRQFLTYIKSCMDIEGVQIDFKVVDKDNPWHQMAHHLANVGRLTKVTRVNLGVVKP